jgi:NTP pyrophosphatase (non-canonical NTP hydrolase)
MNNAQQKVRDFNRMHGLDMVPHHRLLDMLSELGEASKEYLTHADYGRSDFTKGPEWRAEIGDLFYSLCALANETDVNLDRALRESLTKYEDRIDRGNNPGSSAV